MEEYKKAQEKGFNDLKGILQEKGITETIQSYLKRMEDVFIFHVIMNLDWKVILLSAHHKTGADLETFLLHLTDIVESYGED